MNASRLVLPWLTATALGALACSSSPPPPAPEASPEASPQASRDAAADTPGMPSVSPSDVERLDGVVHEVLTAGHYTYLRVGATGAEGAWAVVLGSVEATVGDSLALQVHGTRTAFHSRRLDRDFSELFFARVVHNG